MIPTNTRRHLTVSVIARTDPEVVGSNPVPATSPEGPVSTETGPFRVPAGRCCGGLRRPQFPARVLGNVSPWTRMFSSRASGPSAPTPSIPRSASSSASAPVVRPGSPPPCFPWASRQAPAWCRGSSSGSGRPRSSASASPRPVSPCAWSASPSTSARARTTTGCHATTSPSIPLGPTSCSRRSTGGRSSPGCDRRDSRRRSPGARAPPRAVPCSTRRWPPRQPTGALQAWAAGAGRA